jgi:hypothetical protein
LSAVSMSNSNALPLFNLGQQLVVALLEGGDMIKLALTRLTSRKRVACSLQGDLVVGVYRDAG